VASRDASDECACSECLCVLVLQASEQSAGRWSAERAAHALQPVSCRLEAQRRSKQMTATSKAEQPHMQRKHRPHKQMDQGWHYPMVSFICSQRNSCARTTFFGRSGSEGARVSVHVRQCVIARNGCPPGHCSSTTSRCQHCVHLRLLSIACLPSASIAVLSHCAAWSLIAAQPAPLHRAAPSAASFLRPPSWRTTRSCPITRDRYTHARTRTEGGGHGADCRASSNQTAKEQDSRAPPKRRNNTAVAASARSAQPTLTHSLPLWPAACA